jgi:hypothetical protein
LNKLFSLKNKWAIAIYILLDLICVGMGMGVPIMCILLGFPIGWYIARKITIHIHDLKQILSKMLQGAALSSAFTFIVMALLWGRCIVMLFDPTADLENFGIPMILYEPVASFIGWIILMIFISPFLQLLTTLFGAHVTLMWLLSGSQAEHRSNQP